MSTPKNLLILLVCLVGIGVLLALLFRPVPNPDIIGDLTPDQEKAIQANLVILQGENDSLRHELAKVATRDSMQREAHRKAVQPFKKVAAVLEQDPEIIKLRDSIPKLDRLLKAKDSIIVRHEIRIAEMEHSKHVTKDINERVRANFEERLSGVEQLLADRTLELEQSKKENKKLRRKLFWTKVGGIALCTGFVAISL